MPNIEQFIKNIKDRILNKGEISFEEALFLGEYEFKDNEIFLLLLNSADEIRKKFNGDKFDLCTIVNAKSGNCSEDCSYCAQSSYYNTGAVTYELMNEKEIMKAACEVEEGGVDKFSLVTSGRGLEIGEELYNLKNIYEKLDTERNLSLCASHGIISYEVGKSLKESGVMTYHHNLETSRNFYPSICTTHDYQERIDTCHNAKKAGMKICSGGILGLGESRKDRIEMAFELKNLDVDSIPINILTVIEGTAIALDNYELIKPLEVIKTAAIYKFIVPRAVIRFAGGRHLLGDEFERKGIRGGVSATLTGNYLTTMGSTIERDRGIAGEAGYVLKK